jgi:O-Antigen ligase
MLRARPNPPLEVKRTPWFRLALLWALIASSSIVYWEPAPYEFIAVLLIGATLVSGVRIPAQLGPVAICLAFFVLANLLSLLNIHDESRAVMFVGVTFYLILTFFMFAMMVNEDPKLALATIWHGWTVAAVIAVALGLIGYFELNEWAEIFALSGRARGAFKDPNVFGPYLVPVVIYILAGMKGLKEGLSIRRVALLLFLCIGILTGFSRGAWANLIAAVMAFVGLKLLTTRSIGEFRNLLMSSVMACTAVTVVVLVLIANTQVGADFSDRAQLNQYYDEGTGGRWETMYEGLLIALRTPLGIGPGQSIYHLHQESHDLFITVFLEQGWLGLISFVSFLVISLVRFFRLSIIENPAQRTAQVLCACLVGFLVNTIVIDPFHWRHFYLFMGMGWGLIAAYPVPTLREHQRQILVARRKAIAAGLIPRGRRQQPGIARRHGP